MLKSTADIGAGLGFLAIAAAFGVQYAGLDAEGPSRIFPEILICLITWGGIYYTAKGLWERRKECPGGECPEGEDWRNIWWVSFMAILYAIGIPTLGYWWSTGVFLGVTYLGLVYKTGDIRKSFIKAVIFGAGFSFLVWIGFVLLMGVPTPEGVLW